MGIEPNHRPKLFSSSLKNANSNQQSYKTSPVTKFIEEQNKVNERISNSFSEFHQLMYKFKTEQNQYFNEVISQIQKQEVAHLKFGNRMEQQEIASNTLLDRINHLENLQFEMKKKVDGDELIQQAILDGLTAQESVGQRVSQKLLENEDMLDVINEQLTKHEQLYEKLSETLGIQEAFHQTIMEKLDQQEAVTQKLSRQIDHLKGIIFERFSFLTEKIENSWKTTSNYLFGFLSKEEGKEQQEEVEDIREQ